LSKENMMQPTDLVDTMDNERYFTVKNFALATNRSEQNVRFLMSYGNRIRKIKVVYFAGKPMIPFSELTEYPFTMPGRNSATVYHYNVQGIIKEE
jgi:hypothetical protein